VSTAAQASEPSGPPATAGRRRVGASLLRAAGSARLVRVVAHVAAWLPFVIVLARSMQGSWRVVGDGAEIALRSWPSFSHAALVGQPTELGATVHGEPLHDLGPLEYWLLAPAVRADPVRGLLWGSVLCCMAAASLAIEAAWSVLGRAGGLLAAGTILGMITWSPELAAKPYWNPCFGLMFFLAALAACWAVMSGRHWWWPVLVITAAVAAQAHLMFAIACASLVVLSLLTGLVDAIRELKSPWWAPAGFIAGLACWAAPIIQQLTSTSGNIAGLFHAQAAGPQMGLSFGLKGLAAALAPPPFWWPYAGQPLRVVRVIDSRSAPLAVLILALVAVSMLVAMSWLRSRPLAAMAAVSLLASGAAVLTFAGIPQANDYQNTLGYLMSAVVPAGLLDLLTIGAALVLTGQRVISRLWVARAGRVPRHPGREEPAGTWNRWAGRGVSTAAVVLLVLAAVGVIARIPGFPGDASDAEAVSAATRMIEQAVPPTSQMRLYVVAASSSDRRRVVLGVAWALTGDGYDVRWGEIPPHTQIPRVTVFLDGTRVTRISAPGLRRPGMRASYTAAADGSHPGR
jgi:hypothetical protein